MSSGDASLKKIAGHVNEADYAEIIKGKVNPASQARKKDVLDKLGRTHSVKSGKKWQIFLYGKSRLETNTVLQGIGDVAPRLIDCINSLPSTRKLRELYPAAAKAALQGPMQALARELQNMRTLKAFWHKAAFEGGEVEFWALLPSTIDQTKATIKQKEFHVFDAGEAVEAFCLKMTVSTSVARNKTQTSHQKVIFHDPDHAQLGEIEIRTDTQNWGRVKLWLNANRIMTLLQNRIARNETKPYPQVITYGKVRGL